MIVKYLHFYNNIVPTLQIRSQKLKQLLKLSYDIGPLIKYTWVQPRVYVYDRSYNLYPCIHRNGSQHTYTFNQSEVPAHVMNFTVGSAIFTPSVATCPPVYGDTFACVYFMRSFFVVNIFLPYLGHVLLYKQVDTYFHDIVRRYQVIQNISVDETVWPSIPR